MNRIKFLAQFAVVLFISACALAPRSRDRRAEAPPTPAPAPVENLVAVAPSTPAPVSTPTPAPAITDAHVTQSFEGVAPDQSMKWLKNGNIRFQKGNFRKDGRSQSDVARLAKGQKPHAIVLSCSDSRVPPEHVFDQALGEIFVVRVAGEGLSDSVIASVEYAAEHLGSRLIVVLGHTSCGAVKAALTTPEGKSAGSAALDALVRDIKPRVATFHDDGANSAASKSNAVGVASDLVARSQVISELVHTGKVKIVSALYQLDSGKVEWNE